MGLFGSNQVVGIDFGHSSVKVVGLTVGKNPRVTGSAEVKIENNNGIEKGGPSSEVQAAALKEALKEATPKPIRSREAYLSISEEAVFRKILEIPRTVSEAELPMVTRAAVVEFLPDDIDSLDLDYQPLPTPKEAENQQVMVVAVSKKAISQLLEACAMAGVTVRGIDPKPSALMRSVVSPKTTEPLVVVNIGTATSTLALCADHAVWVASTVSLGSSILIDPATGEIDPEKKTEKLNRLVTALVDELDHVIKFYANRGGGAPAEVKQVLLTGSGSLTEGLDACFAKETDLKVTFGQVPFAVPQSCDRRFMGALGSALYPLFESL